MGSGVWVLSSATKGIGVDLCVVVCGALCKGIPSESIWLGTSSPPLGVGHRKEKACVWSIPEPVFTDTSVESPWSLFTACTREKARAPLGGSGQCRVLCWLHPLNLSKWLYWQKPQSVVAFSVHYLIEQMFFERFLCARCCYIDRDSQGSLLEALKRLGEIPLITHQRNSF